MVFRNPGKGCPANPFKHILFVSEYARNGVLRIALYVDWNAYGPAFSVHKVYLKSTLKIRHRSGTSLLGRKVETAVGILFGWNVCDKFDGIVCCG